MDDEQRFTEFIWERLLACGYTPSDIQDLMQTWTAGILLSDAVTERFGYDKTPVQGGKSRLMGYVDTAVRESYRDRRPESAAHESTAFDFQDECYG